MSNRALVVLVGVAAGLLVAMVPDGGVPIVALVAAVAAGMLLPNEPVSAAVLVLAPTTVVAIVRATVDSDRDVGAAVLALLSALFVTAVATHVTAGVVLRRQR